MANKNSLFYSVKDFKKIVLTLKKISGYILCDFAIVGGVANRALFSDWAKKIKHSLAVAGMTIARQRPSTAKGIVFMLLEDERGQVNLIVPTPLRASTGRRSHRAARLRARPLRAGGGEPERARFGDRVARTARAPCRRQRHRVGVVAEASFLRPPVEKPNAAHCANLLTVPGTEVSEECASCSTAHSLEERGESPESLGGLSGESFAVLGSGRFV